MRRTIIPIIAALLALPLAASAEEPAALKAALQRALDAGDGAALIALAELKGAPAMMHFMLHGVASDCRGAGVCTVALAPIDAEWEKRNGEAAKRGLESTAKPEGLVKIIGRPRDPKTEAGKNRMSMTMPYAQVAGRYRLVGQRFGAAKRARLEAVTAQAAAEATLAMGIPDEPTRPERNKAWKTGATALPAGGGAPGVAYLATVRARTAAVRADDPDAAVAATGDWGKFVLGPLDRQGKPVPLDRRKAKLRAQALRWETEAEVRGGWIKGPMAVLVVEGHNGIGNIVRGAQLMKQVNGRWETDASDFVEIPAG